MKLDRQSLDQSNNALARELFEPITNKSAYENQEEDMRDMNRFYGWKILADDDPIFRDPEYARLYWNLKKADGFGMFHHNTNHIYKLFNEEWNKLAPKNVDPPGYFTMNGSQANESLYSIVAENLSENLGKNYLPEDIEILSFKDMYLAAPSNTRMGRRSLLYGAEKPENANVILPSPYTDYFGELSADEVKRLKIIEDSVFEKLNSYVANRKNKKLGAIMIEAILGAGGVKFYRPEFLLSLRKWADKHSVFIVADEVLTGGGRTGKFFAYEHYEGFEPDLITFGKGLLVSGVTSVYRYGAKMRTNINQGPVTNENYAEAVLRSSFVMRRIREGNLMQNAEINGQYILDIARKQLSSMGPRRDSIPDNEVRGIGFLIHLPYQLRIQARSDGHGRYTPALSLTKEKIDEIFK